MWLMMKKNGLIVLIEEEWMVNDNTLESTWVVDFTFKTIQFGLPLYTCMCPNVKGYELHIFLMIFSVDVNSGQKGISPRIFNTSKCNND